MYLKEIKAYGFKSFADKTTIEFSKDITGIVGPNGSGKSNIVDAVRWVLGEQSIKSLRGESSNDIIFSGSKDRKALSSAFVTLIFDNTDHHLPIEFDEVSVKRVAFRNGDNEYYLNNEKCRLKDITELFTDSGAAKESFNIISQGKIDEILSTKPDDRRVVFEEAAGVLKYKKRKEEAIRKLDRTNDNITRINDIISEIDKTIAPLKEQRDKTLKYNETKSKLENIEIALITEDIETLNIEYKQLQEKIISAVDNISILKTSISSNDSIYEKSKLKQKELENNIYENQNLLIKYNKEREEIDSKIKLLNERSKYNKDNAVNNQVLLIKENIYKLQNEINELENKLSICQKIIGDNNEKVKENRQIYNEKITIKNKKELLYNNNNRKINEYKDKINVLEEEINNGGGLPYPVKCILNNPKFSGVHNIVGSLIEMEEKYTLAISTALGVSSSYLVVETASIAKELIYYLKDNNLGRATFYPLNEIKPRFLDNDILNDIKNTYGFIGIASDLVNYDDKYHNVISNLLGNVLIVSDLDTAGIVSKKTGNRVRVVTLNGSVINIGGSLTGGSKHKTKNIISLKYELEEDKHFLEKLTNDNKNIDKEIKNIYQEINHLDNTNNEISMIINNNYHDKRYYIKKQEELNHQLELLKNEMKDLDIIGENTESEEIKRLQKEYYELQKQITDLEKEINLAKLDKEKAENDVSEIIDITKINNDKLSKMEKELSSWEIRKGKIDVKLDNLLLDLNNDYNLTFESAKQNYKLDIDIDETRDMVRNYKNIINEIGIVNPLAPDEYDKASERYNFLTSQKDDLLKAEDTLLDIIKEMDDIMKDKFLETFNNINVAFKRIFKELFKGGDASLTLSNPQDLLKTGIEIFAEPPGKKLQSISLLSGGEKTFTAISLLFAILNVRPVPFCILDEVEAALDDANVISFGNYLSKYQDKTQFILITHKKKTMEFVNVLYGITMQEAGISKLVSVKLEDIGKK